MPIPQHILESKYFIENISYEQAQGILCDSPGLFLVRATEDKINIAIHSCQGRPFSPGMSENKIKYKDQFFETLDELIDFLMKKDSARYQRAITRPFDYVEQAFVGLHHVILTNKELNRIRKAKISADEINQSKIKTLVLGSRYIVDELMTPLSKALINNNTIRELRIIADLRYDNEEYAKESLTFIENIFRSNYLKKLHFRCDFNMNQIEKINEGLRINHCLESFYLFAFTDDFRINAEQFGRALTAMKGHPNLRKVYIAVSHANKNNKEDFKSLFMNSKIKEIEISCWDDDREITNQEMKELLSSPELLHNTTLTNFNFGDTKIKNSLMKRNKVYDEPTLKSKCLNFLVDPKNRAKIPRKKSSEKMSDKEIKKFIGNDLSDLIFWDVPKKMGKRQNNEEMEEDKGADIREFRNN